MPEVDVVFTVVGVRCNVGFAVLTCSIIVLLSSQNAVAASAPAVAECYQGPASCNGSQTYASGLYESPIDGNLYNYDSATGLLVLSGPCNIAGCNNPPDITASQVQAGSSCFYLNPTTLQGGDNWDSYSTVYSGEGNCISFAFYKNTVNNAYFVDTRASVIEVAPAALSPYIQEIVEKGYDSTGQLVGQGTWTYMDCTPYASVAACDYYPGPGAIAVQACATGTLATATTWCDSYATEVCMQELLYQQALSSKPEAETAVNCFPLT